AHIPNVLFPEENESDILEVEEEHRDKVHVTYAKTIGDVLNAALVGFGLSEKSKAAGKPTRTGRKKETRPAAAPRPR
ncbi:MAG TPA: S16 family serine protease, partial [bacterium]|nr:S16 family serine protease [bacterium]